jgi:hypothetical protein
VSLGKKGTPVRMSQFPCCRCGKKADGKLANGYVSWYFPEDHRWCYYTRWCTPDFMEDILPIIAHHKELGEMQESQCILCSAEVAEPMQTFLTLYPPKQEQKDYTFTTCTDCFETFRNNLAQGGKFVKDRGARDGAQNGAPSTTESVWAQVEL